MSDSEKPKSTWQEPIKKIRLELTALCAFIERKCEQLSKLLERWAFIDILEHAGRFTVLVAVIFYIKGCPERQRQAVDQRKAKHYQAWQVINIARGNRSGGGRKDALEDLNKDNVSLVGINISKAYLPMLNLENADLLDANFIGAELPDANLTEANLAGANLTGAHLFDANFPGANLYGADLAGANFMSANLVAADLRHANLAGAYLVSTNLTRARLMGANLTGACLDSANLTGANLRKANLKDIKEWKNIKSIELANIYDVNNPPEGFEEWAIENGAFRIGDDEEWLKSRREKRQEKKKRKK